MREPCLSDLVEDLLHQASWNERLPALYAAGDPEIVELVHREGMPTTGPVALLREAITLIQAEIERVEICGNNSRPPT